jgi:hypothetical protein
MASQFQKELEQLINEYSKENESNTPDFILAKYLNEVLKNFNAAVNEREEWYGRIPHLNDLGMENPDPNYDNTGNPPPIPPPNICINDGQLPTN